MERRVGIEPCLPERGGRRPRVMRQQLRHPIERRLRETERLADVAHGRARLIADDIGNHGGVIAAVLLVDVLNYLFAPLVHHVEIDVRRLVPLSGKKALEQQIDQRRIGGRHTQRVTDHGVRCRAAALTDDLFPLTELNDVVHREEVAAVIELLDHIQLFFELRHGDIFFLRFSSVHQTLLQAFAREMPEPR